MRIRLAQIEAMLCLAAALELPLEVQAQTNHLPGVVVNWGRNDSDQERVPVGLRDVIAIAAGDWHNLALKSDGTVVGWGNNDSGQSTVPPGLGEITSIAAGGSHSLALQSNGTVVAWGSNERGESAVPANLRGVVAVAAGGNHSLALKSDRTVVAWGDNFYGQTTVPTNLANVIAVAAGASHSLALKSDGTVVAWGNNAYGQSTVPSDLHEVVALAAGWYHSLALKSDGTVVAWGYVFYGQTIVPTGLSNVTSIAAGWVHSLALKSNGTVVAWGDNLYGETTVPAGLRGVIALAGGVWHSLALVAESTGGPPLILASAPNQTLGIECAAELAVNVVGSDPLTYQWFFNGNIPIDGGTHAILELTNAQPSQSGSYSCVVTNSLGSATSSAAAIAVVGIAPSIQTWGPSQAALVGATVELDVGASGGCQPLAYQWFFNSVTLEMATNSTLQLTNVQLFQAGSYTVLVSNNFGAVTSFPAILTIVGDVPGPGTLAVAAISQNSGGYSAPADSLHFIFGPCPDASVPRQGLFDTLVLTTDDIGRVFPVTQADDTDFVAVVSTLTNGISDWVGYYFQAGPGGGGMSSTEKYLFSPLPPGGNGIDFAGFHIDNLALEVQALSFSPYSFSLRLYVNSESWSRPAILTSPQSQTVDGGSSVDFHVRAVGAPPMASQWFFNAKELAGATNFHLRLPKVQSAQSGAYTLVLSNAYGAVTSAPAILTVLAVPPKLLASPVDQTATVGGSADFTVIASGSPPLSYQWLFDGSPITEATNTDLYLVNLQLSQAGPYAVVITNTVGAITSPPAILRVIGSPPTILASPLGQTAQVGGSADFAVIASGSPPLSYQWYLDHTNAIAGATNADLHLANVQLSDSGTYSAVVTNPFGTNESAAAPLTVLPVQGFQNLDFEAATFVPMQGGYAGEVQIGAALPGWSVLTQVPYLLYNNLFLDSAGVSILDNQAWQSGFTPFQGKYTVVLEGGFSLSGTFNRLAVAIAQNVSLPASARTMLFDARLMSGGESYFAVSIAGQSLPFYPLASYTNYTLYKVDVSGFAGQTAELRFTAYPHPSPGPAINIVYLDDIRFSNSPPASPPVILTSPFSQTVGAGSNVVFGVIATGVPAPEYQWFLNGTKAIAGATNPTLQLPNVTLAQSGAYTVVVSNSCGSAASAPALLTVLDPFIVSQPLNQTVDARTAVSLSVGSAGTPPLGYQWFKNGAPVSDGANVSGAQAATLILSNVASTDAGGYSVIVSNRYGTLTSAVAYLVVNWPPFQVLHSFTGGEGGDSPFAGLVESAGTLYGTTSYGGTANFGTVFKVNTDGTGFTVLHRFNGFDGANPHAALVLSGTTLYGTTEEGGSEFVPYSWNGYGTVFKLNTDGSQYTVIKSFTGHDGGAAPEAGLVLSGETLYGTTSFGGQGDQGVIFKINTDSSGFGVLHNLTGLEGAGPSGGLLLSGDTLYGTARENAIGLSVYGNGVVFKLNTNGGNYTVLHNFSDAEASQPSGDLLLADNVLYGTTLSGAIFKVNKDGSEFQVLKRCNEQEGVGVPLGLVLSGRTLLGTTAGTAGDTVFKIDIDGDAFRVIKSFSDSEGKYPQGGLVLSGTALYGTAGAGGESNHGVVFRLSVPIPVIQRAPTSQIAELGSTARLGVLAAGEPVLFYQWFLNGSNALGGFSTNRTLLLTNLQPAQAGAYTVVVSNAFGSLSGEPALLSVIPAVARKLVPGLILKGQTGSLWNLDVTGDLCPPPKWTAFDSVVLTNDTQWYFDLSWPQPLLRFFRVGRPGSPGVPAAPDIHLIPALTLTGQVGSRWRVEAINQFGPAGGWFPLSTVVLTDSSQLYFDTSVIGQPPRLWRVVPLP